MVKWWNGETINLTVEKDTIDYHCIAIYRTYSRFLMVSAVSQQCLGFTSFSSFCIIFGLSSSSAFITSWRQRCDFKKITRTCKNHQEPPRTTKNHQEPLRTNAILFVLTVQIIIGDNGHGSKLCYFGAHRIGWQMDVYPEKITAYCRHVKLSAKIARQNMRTVIQCPNQHGPRGTRLHELHEACCKKA